jgi:hypothetical protein
MSDIEVGGVVELCNLCDERSTTVLNEAGPGGALMGFINLIPDLGPVFQSLVTPLLE